MAFPLQQYLRECAWVLRYTYMVFHVMFCVRIDCSKTNTRSACVTATTVT